MARMVCGCSLTNSPTVTTNGGSAAMIACATSGVTWRGLLV